MSGGTTLLHECLKCGKHIQCTWITETYNEVVTCPACQGAAVDVNFLHKYRKPELEPKVPLLKIELDDLQIAPIVFYKGEEITMKTALSLDWITRDETMSGNYINFAISHLEESAKNIVKTISFESQDNNRESYSVSTTNHVKGIGYSGN